MESTTHLLLPYLLASQAQKHVTHNEALRLLDAMVQLAVLDRDRTTPPGSPDDGDRHIVASGATGLWAGWDLNIAYWVDGAWTRLVPRPGWLAWIAEEAAFVAWDGAAWQALGVPEDFSDADFSLVNAADPTKKAVFNLSGLSAGATRTFTLPNSSSELAILAGTQTFTGAKTFSGALTASGAVATIGTATGAAAYGLGTGATASGATKTVNLGTGGAAGSDTVVNIGPATAGADGTTVINTPTVTFANAVTEVGMPQANLTAQHLGLGGAAADSTNRLSVNAPAMLFNHAGAGIEATLNKNAPGNDAAVAFKTGFSARALIGLLGSDAFALKVSADGASFSPVFAVDPATGALDFLVAPTVLGAALGGGGASLSDIPDNVFSLADDVDPSKRAAFDLSGISAGVLRIFTLPDASTELAGLAGAQTFTGPKTFAAPLTVSAAAAALGTSAANAAYDLGGGATAPGNTKTVNIGTAGLAGSDTVVNIGSAIAGADGTTVINTPTVTFANAVTEVAMLQANLTASLLGLGGASADAVNRLSVNTPAVLLNHAGAGIEATVNKNAPANDAAVAFKTGFSARALLGLLGGDDFTIKVSPDGSAYFTALVVDPSSGRVKLPAPLILESLAATPAAPAANTLSLAARHWAGADWPEVARPNGQRFPLQPHLGTARVARWSPSNNTTIVNEGMSRMVVGTVTTPAIATTGLAASMRRWRVTSAAIADSVSEERSGVLVCWRGNAAGLGGWTYTQRFLLSTLQPTGMGFFGLYGATAALATTLTLSAFVNCIGLGFQRGTHANWQLVSNDASGSPSLTDLGPSFPVNSTTNVLTLLIYAPPNGSSVWVRVTEEVSGAVAEFEITADLPAATQLLAPRNYLNNGATAAAVAYDSTGIYIETDF